MLGVADGPVSLELSVKAAVHGGDIDTMLDLMPMAEALCASSIWLRYSPEFKTLRSRYDVGERRKLLPHRPSAQRVPDIDAA
jgi:hypothetical protein